MLTYTDIVAMLEETGLPYAYYQFAEGESPPPPFVIYLSYGSHNFSADGVVYQKVNQLAIELYTSKKDPDTEELLEDVLDTHELFYDKTETWIESEKLYEIVYELEV